MGHSTEQFCVPAVMLNTYIILKNSYNNILGLIIIMVSTYRENMIQRPKHTCPRLQLISDVAAIQIGPSELMNTTVSFANDHYLPNQFTGGFCQKKKFFFPSKMIYSKTQKSKGQEAQNSREMQGFNLGSRLDVQRWV